MPCAIMLSTEIKNLQQKLKTYDTVLKGYVFKDVFLHVYGYGKIDPKKLSFFNMADYGAASVIYDISLFICFCTYIEHYCYYFRSSIVQDTFCKFHRNPKKTKKVKEVYKDVWLQSGNRFRIHRT